jgi:hypothetical protein
VVSIPTCSEHSLSYGEWVNLVIVSAWFYEHPHCTDSDILLFFFLLTNVRILSRFGYRPLLNALRVNVNI